MKNKKKKEAGVKPPRVYIKGVVRWGSRATDDKKQKQADKSYGW
jgi:hypothetical protein